MASAGLKEDKLKVHVYSKSKYLEPEVFYFVQKKNKDTEKSIDRQPYLLAIIAVISTLNCVALNVRVHNAGYSVSRPQGDVGRYTSISHHHHGEVQFLGRYALLRKSKERQVVDGLNNLHYSPVVVRWPLYTNITVNLSRDLAPLVDTNVL